MTDKNLTPSEKLEVKQNEIKTSNNEIAVKIGYSFGEFIYNKNQVLNEFDVRIQASSRAMFEAGFLLILLKDNENHGDFKKLLDGRGLSVRTAQRMMLVAKKLGSMRNNTINILDKSKLYELMVFDESELKDLDEGKNVGELKLDDVDKMTSRELKQAVRKHRAERESLEADLNAANTKTSAANKRAAVYESARTINYPKVSNDIIATVGSITLKTDQCASTLCDLKTTIEAIVNKSIDDEHNRMNQDDVIAFITNINTNLAMAQIRFSQAVLNIQDIVEAYVGDDAKLDEVGQLLNADEFPE